MSTRNDQGSDKQTYVRKKVDAWGRYFANRFGMELGFWRRLGKAAMIPELSVTIKNEC